MVGAQELSYSHSSGKKQHPFENHPFYRTEKGIEELRKGLDQVPGDRDSSPIVHFASPYYSFVPEDLYEEEDRARMLELAFSEGFGPEEIRAERSLLTDARVVHWFPEQLQKALKDRFPGFVPHHFTIPAIETLLALQHRAGRATGLAHIRQGEVDVGFAAEGKLRIFNSFSYANAEELVYFILHTWRTCGAGEKLQRFHVTGTTPQKDERELLERYVEGLVLHEDGKGHWNSFLLEELQDLEDHSRQA
jgi:hypothetical protein